jgi:glycosyltransferase involved in cell wall biosynthesis
MDTIVIEQLPVLRRSLRLAVVTETYPPEINGVALSLARFVEGLRERNHEIQLVRPRQGQGEKAVREGAFSELLTRGMPIPRYPDLRMGLPAKRLLARQWALQRPDLVHIVTEGPLGWSALQVALKLRIPACSDFRTNFHAYSQHYGIGWLKKPIVAYLRKFHNRTQLTMVPTEQMRTELGAHGFRNLRVLARGVDTMLFHPRRRSADLRAQWGADEDTLVAIYVGRLAAEKNLDALVAAYRDIRRHQARSRLVLVGEGPEESRLRASLPDAIFAGSQRGEALATHFASADLFLFPSRTETFGNVTVEAMASGLPVVAYDYAAAGEHVRHGRGGLLAPFARADDFGVLAGELAAVHACDRARLVGMGRDARAAAEALDWRAVVGQLENLLHGVAAAVPTGARP